ncbi:unnamed protein product [Clonostachys rosea]|uniref:F-box domain-containing protein n=1 Tax=Bionectria ochroleuca TaxID=29856 RepID=A0ABY6UR77_BIOOC|nr:unnamed protein product [Clonostachys rosea]
MQRAEITGIQYLRINSSMRVTGTLLQTCPALTTLDICQSVQLWKLQDVPPSVKRLALTLNDDCYGIGIPSLRVDYIRDIIRRNSGLEDLILHDAKKAHEPFTLNDIKDRQMNTRNTLRSCLRIQAVAKAAASSDHSMETHIFVHSPPIPLDKDGWYRDWYSDCIRSLGEALPHLRQMCIISEFPVYWQSSR